MLNLCIIPFTATIDTEFNLRLSQILKLPVLILDTMQFLQNSTRIHDFVVFFVYDVIDRGWDALNYLHHKELIHFFVSQERNLLRICVMRPNILVVTVDKCKAGIIVYHFLWNILSKHLLTVAFKIK